MLIYILRNLFSKVGGGGAWPPLSPKVVLSVPGHNRTNIMFGKGAGKRKEGKSNEGKSFMLFDCPSEKKS